MPTCRVYIANRLMSELPLQPAGNIEGALSYLRVTATEPSSADEPGTADKKQSGICVQSISVTARNTA